MNLHSHFSWTFLSKGERCMRLSLCEAPTQKDQHNGQPQYRETSRPIREVTLHSGLSSFLKWTHMDSNIPANPAYGAYICQLVRYARICTSKVDFMNRLRGLSLRLRQQGFETNLLQKSFNKFFNWHDVIVVKYGATLREMRLAIQAWIAPSHPYITYLLLRLFFQLYLGTCARAILFLFLFIINLIDVCI